MEEGEAPSTIRHLTTPLQTGGEQQKISEGNKHHDYAFELAATGSLRSHPRGPLLGLLASRSHRKQEKTRKYIGRIQKHDYAFELASMGPLRSHPWGPLLRLLASRSHRKLCCFDGLKKIEKMKKERQSSTNPGKYV